MTSCLIVGQGVAGSVLAWTLHGRGKHVRLVGNSRGPTASLAAAGIVNPLTGRKLVRTWKAEQLFPFLNTFYSDLERQLGQQFLYQTDIYRPYRSIGEQNTYLAQTADPGIAAFVRASSDDDRFRPYIHNPFGGLTVTGSGWVDTRRLLASVRTYFQTLGLYTEAHCSIDELVLNPDSVVWKGETYDVIIFCEGPVGEQNPFFNWLPYSPVKGQLLEIVSDEYALPEIINQGVFILPYGSGRCRVGATYSWHDLDWQTTDEGKRFLVEKLNGLLKTPYQIVDQWAGIRPATKDRRPFIGLHPQHRTVGIFNGLGTKGLSLAPYFAGQFADFLDGRKDLEREVNIERFFSLYYSI